MISFESGIRMDIGYISNCGNVRNENQDRFLAVKKVIDDKEVILCMVADGMGGCNHGEFASSKISKKIAEWWNTELVGFLNEELVYSYISQSLDNLILKSNEDINLYAKTKNISTGTTLSLLVGYGNQAILKHIGDSRIYLKRNNEWLQLTQDHTWEQSEKDKGNNPFKDVDFKRKRGSLTNALGAGRKCKIDTQMMQMVKGDFYLICSDGFYRYANLTDIDFTYKKSQEILLEFSKEISKTRADDNFTAILINNI